MEQLPGAAVSTLRASNALRALGHSTADLHRPASAKSFAGNGPTLSLVPGRRLGRQASLARRCGGGGGLRPPAALPLFDMSVAVIDSLNLMRASMEEEVVLQSTLAVPAHHALACKLEAYGIGSPFAAPRLQAAVQGELSEADKQFAACLAAPPDLDFANNATPGFSIRRMASLGVLQHSPSLAAAQREAEAAPATPAAAAGRAAAGGGSGGGGGSVTTPGSLRRGGELLRSPSVQPDGSDVKRRRAQQATGGGVGSGGGGGGMRRDSGPMSSGGLVLDAAEDGEFDRQFGGQTPPALASLFDGCSDAVAALVGTGYLLLRAAGFSARAPRAVEGLNTGLRRLSMGRASGAAAAAAAAAAFQEGPSAALGA